jgi:hypothetical protein
MQMETATVAEKKKDERIPFMVRLEPELHSQLRFYAMARGKHLSEIITAWIEEGWERVPNREIYAKVASTATKAAAEPEAPAKPSKKK